MPTASDNEFKSLRPHKQKHELLRDNALSNTGVPLINTCSYNNRSIMEHSYYYILFTVSHSSTCLK